MAQTLRTGAVVFLCVLVGIAAVTAGAAPVAAEDDDDDLPPLPAVYHGELTVADGSVDSPVLIEVVADDTVQDTIVTDDTGAIGGPTISDEKLEVQEPEETDIEFHIGGSPVTVVSVNDESVNDESIAFASGDQQIVLEADASDLEPTVDLTIDNAPETVDAGDTVTVDATIENTGPVATSQDVELVDFNGSVVDTDAVDLGIDESATTSLTWETTEADAADGDLTVRIGETTATQSLTIEAVGPPAVAQPSPGGATSGDDETELPDGVVGIDEQTIVSDDDAGVSQVRFTDVTDVESVTWQSVGVNGTATATMYTEVPDETAPVPGAMMSVSQITVPDEVQNEPATVQFTINASPLESMDASPDELRVFHFADGEWTPLETETIETEDTDTVLIQTEVDGFSYFAVSAVSEPTAEFTMDPTEPDTEVPVSLDASSSTTTYGEIVSYDWTINGDTASGETIETTLPDADSVTVELTVENDAGLTDSTTQSVSIAGGDADTGATDDGVPGFSVVVTLLAVLLSVAALRYRM